MHRQNIFKNGRAISTGVVVINPQSCGSALGSNASGAGGLLVKMWTSPGQIICLYHNGKDCYSHRSSRESLLLLLTDGDIEQKKGEEAPPQPLDSTVPPQQETCKSNTQAVRQGFFSPSTDQSEMMSRRRCWIIREGEVRWGEEKASPKPGERCRLHLIGSGGFWEETGYASATETSTSSFPVARTTGPVTAHFRQTRRTVTCQTGDETWDFPSDWWIHFWVLKQKVFIVEEQALRPFKSENAFFLNIYHNLLIQ